MKNNGDESLLKDVLHDFLNTREVRQKYNEVRLRQAWLEVTGVTAERYTEKVTLKKNGVLRVDISAAALRQDLVFSRTSLIAQLNAAVGETLVKELEIG